MSNLFLRKTVKLFAADDYIIKAIGNHTNKVVDDERIFYAGDCKSGGSTIVEALASGQMTAQKVMAFFKEER